MRIRRWEEEVEYDRYMRDRTEEGWPAARPARLRELAAALRAPARSACELAPACIRFGLAILREAVCGLLLSPPGTTAAKSILHAVSADLA